MGNRIQVLLKLLGPKGQAFKPEWFIAHWLASKPCDETGDIRYTNIVPGGTENGGYISFAVTKGQDTDRSYTIYNKGKNEITRYRMEQRYQSRAGERFFALRG